MRGRTTKLTARQAELLRYLFNFRRLHGDSPTLKMIVSDLHLASNRSAIDMLRSLSTKGFLERAAKTSRSTMLTEKALVALGLLVTPNFSDPVFNPNPKGAVISTVYNPPSAQSSYTNAHAPSWVDTKQPTGTNLDPDASEILRSLKNAASIITHAGSWSEPNLEPQTMIHPLPIFVIACGAIYVMFGSDTKGAILFVIITSVVIIRSTR